MRRPPQQRRSPGRSGPAWIALCKRVHREESNCRYCKKYLLHDVPVGHPDKAVVDHIIPLDQDGPPLARDNVCAACWDCNTKKGNRTPDQWRAAMAAQAAGPAVYVSMPRVTR